MNTLTAHGTISEALDADPTVADWLPEDAELEPPQVLPAALTAAALLSGRLPDCESLADLADAVRHFRLLLGNVVTCGEWLDQTGGVVYQSLLRQLLQLVLDPLP